jgi:DNA replication ATP-dependent helicase Dna2
MMSACAKDVLQWTDVCYTRRFALAHVDINTKLTFGLQAVEGIDDTSSEIAQIFDDKTGHLTQQQCEFFKRWESLISLEEQEMLRFRKELWTMGAEEREKSGRCFANMVMVPLSSSASAAGPSSSKMTRFTYTFSRKPTLSQAKAIFSSPSKPAKSTAKLPNADSSLLSGHITRGDPVTISIEPDFLALSRGYVLELEPEHVTVGVDAELNVSSLFNRYHVTNGKEVVFRIDKDEMTAGIGRIRNNLAKLFYKGGDTRRLELVVDLKRPEFDHQDAPSAPQAPMSTADAASKSVLNESQQQAMAKVLSAQDYAILLGMPGTGKTTTVAEIIKELVRRGKSVLLSSYTHSAVDTILMKLLDADFEILRLGNADKVCGVL